MYICIHVYKKKKKRLVGGSPSCAAEPQASTYYTGKWIAESNHHNTCMNENSHSGPCSATLKVLQKPTSELCCNMFNII